MTRDGIIAAAIFLGLAGVVLVIQSFASADSLLYSVGLILSGSIFGVAIYVWVAGPIVAFVLWRAFLALVPVAAVSALLVYILLSIEAIDLDTRILAGLIAAIVVAAGWIVGFVTQELRRNDERDELRGDLIEALQVEIAFMIARGEKVDWDREVERATTSFFKDGRYVPYVHLRLPADALSKIQENIELLDKDQIEAVSAYAHLVNETRQLTTRIADPSYARLDTERRKQVFVFWLGLQKRIPDAGENALKVLSKRPVRGLIRRPK